MMDFMAVARTYKLQHQVQGEKFFYEVGQYTSIRLCLVDMYEKLVMEKKCTEIEKLQSEDKRRLWDLATLYRRVLVPGAVEDKEYLKELCRAIHGFECYLKSNS
jgi:hypothetical protein